MGSFSLALCLILVTFQRILAVQAASGGDCFDLSDPETGLQLDNDEEDPPDDPPLSPDGPPLSPDDSPLSPNGPPLPPDNPLMSKTLYAEQVS